MSKMLYRIYPKGESVLNPNSKHYTLVECKDGSFLEVKNPDNNNTKTKFESVEAWAISHDTPLEDVNAEDDSKPEKPKGPEIKIPDSDFKYGYWLYKTINKFQKKLLKNPAFIETFNNFCDTYNTYQYKVYASEWELVRGTLEKYNPKWITFTDKVNTYGKGEERDTQFGGLTWSFRETYYGNDVETLKARNEEKQQISSEIKPLFKTLCELLSTTLLPKLEKKYETMKAKATIADSKRRLKVYDNAIRKVMWKIETNMRHIQGYEKDIKHYKKTKEEYKKKIEEAEAKIAKFNVVRGTTSSV